MSRRFHDRKQAGQQLAAALDAYKGRKDVIVLGLPRGGVPVAAEVAQSLGVPLDIFTVRKLGVPGREELAMGAIATGGARVLNRQIINQLGISQDKIDAVTDAEKRELARREAAYRTGRSAPSLRGKTVIVVDDGLATGSTMSAAVRGIKQQHPAKIIVAVPTGSDSGCYVLGHAADELVCLMTPRDFRAVGEWYDVFDQTEDATVQRLLEEAHQRMTAI